MDFRPPVFSSYRSPVFALNGMVASGQPLAAEAGLHILRGGGNAADAAVAVAGALAVTEPCSTGLGGDAFALYYEAASGQVVALNGSGRAPAALSLSLLEKEGVPTGPDRGFPDPFHAHMVTVPGAAAAWSDLSARFGRLPLTISLAPAIALASEGFPVAPLTAYFWGRGAERQLSKKPGGHQLMIDGRGPRPGEIFRNPNLAHTLQALAEGGRAAFYEGAIAERIVAAVSALGGVMTLSDLASHGSDWPEPISVDYGGFRVHECPPNGQGIAALLALAILRQFDLPSDPLSAIRLHLVIEALRLAFADTRWYNADPAVVAIPVADLLSEGYAAERAKCIRFDRATIDQVRGVPVAGTDTVCFCVVDGEGNACSFINSNYMGFGTGIVPEGCGFSLQNRGHGFSLDPSHPNALAPKKRPYHTIIPGLLTDPVTGGLAGPFGVMGGFMQPQGHVQVVLALAADSANPQVALDRPRICIEDGTAGGAVALEEGIPPSVGDALSAMGHTVRMVSGYERALFGRGQVILRDPVTGVLCGGSDPRADGLAVGW